MTITARRQTVASPRSVPWLYLCLTLAAVAAWCPVVGAWAALFALVAAPMIASHRHEANP